MTLKRSLVISLHQFITSSKHISSQIVSTFVPHLDFKLILINYVISRGIVLNLPPIISIKNLLKYHF